VLARKQRFLLAQHNSRRSDKLGKWGLPGGRLKNPEKPKAGLRRELVEELRLRVPYLVAVGDWRFRGHTHRVFGCEIEASVEWFDSGELLGVGWFSYEEVHGMAQADRLRTGFELEAIDAFRRRVQAPLGHFVERRQRKRPRVDEALTPADWTSQ
jgi:8-oxo-dGTP pyrophosphatase MutT (NUDIX family)